MDIGLKAFRRSSLVLPTAIRKRYRTSIARNSKVAALVTHVKNNVKTEEHLATVGLISWRTMCLAVTIITLTLIQLSVGYEFGLLLNPHDGHPTASIVVKGIRIVLVVLSALLAAEIVQFHYKRMEYLKLRNVIGPKQTIFRSNWGMLMEIVACAVIPFPGLETITKGDPSLPIILAIAVFFKLYLLKRYLHYKNPNQSQTEEQLSPIAMMAHDGAVYVKKLVDDEPFLFGVLSFSGLVGLTAYFLTIMETTFCAYHKYDGCISITWCDSIWIVLISITTIGYGDLWVHSYGGRVLVVVAGTIGYILNAVLFSLTLKFCDLAIHESKVFAFLSRATLNKESKQMSALLIQSFWKKSVKMKTSLIWNDAVVKNTFYRKHTGSLDAKIDASIKALRLIRYDKKPRIDAVDQAGIMKKTRETCCLNIQEIREAITLIHNLRKKRCVKPISDKLRKKSNSSVSGTIAGCVINEMRHNLTSPSKDINNVIEAYVADVEAKVQALQRSVKEILPESPQI